jgi:hypothetical protein
MMVMQPPLGAAPRWVRMPSRRNVSSALSLQLRYTYAVVFAAATPYVATGCGDAFPTPHQPWSNRAKRSSVSEQPSKRAAPIKASSIKSVRIASTKEGRRGRSNRSTRAPQSSQPCDQGARAGQECPIAFHGKQLTDTESACRLLRCLPRAPRFADAAFCSISSRSLP